MLLVAPPDLPALSHWFAPERPGPMIFEHVVTTGVGRVLVDRGDSAENAGRADRAGLVVAELPGENVALRGDPALITAVPDLAGLVEAPVEWLPALRAHDPGLAVWERLVAVLPDDVAVPSPRIGTRLLGPSDAAALDRLEPDLRWISETWGGAAGLATAGTARGAFVGGELASVAVPFFVGARHEDMGVVTAPAHRGSGLSTACAAALAADIRARGRRPSWTTSPRNAASRAVAARLGFRHVRDDVLYVVRTAPPD